MNVELKVKPTLDLDLYGEQALGGPTSTYRAIREAGPAVWMPRNRLWAMGRYADVKAALRNDTVFASGHGVAANGLANRLGRDTVLSSDGEVHARRRGVMLDFLAARRVAALEETIAARAEVVVDRLMERDRFDAVHDFASALPVEVVADLVGLRVSPDRMLRWGAATFDALGPINRRGVRAARGGLGLKLFGSRLREADVAPGSWAAGIFAAAARGDLSQAEAKAMVIDFTAPSLDTTILASAEMLRLLGQNPELWARIRADEHLVNAMVAESVRIASPIRGFTRRAAVDTTVDGQSIPAGARVALLFASANWDERQFANPDHVDLNRAANQQLGWGHGPHACVGLHLAKLEMSALLHAMRPRVSEIRLLGPGTALRNNTLQGLIALPAAFR